LDSRQTYRTQPTDYERTDRNVSKSFKATENIDSQLRNQAGSWRQDAKLSSERSSSKSGTRILDDYGGDRYAINDYGKASQSPRSAASGIMRSGMENGRFDNSDVTSRHQDMQYVRNSSRDQTDLRNDRYDFSAQPAGSGDRYYPRTAADFDDYRSRLKGSSSAYDDFDGRSYRQGSATNSQPSPSPRDALKSNRDTSALAAKLRADDEVDSYRGSSRYGLSSSEANARSKTYAGEMERKVGAYNARDLKSDGKASRLLDADTSYGRQRDVKRDFLDRYGDTFLTESERIVETPRSGTTGVKASSTKREDTAQGSGYHSPKPGRDARLKTVSAVAGADDGRLTEKKKTADRADNVSRTAASETNKARTTPGGGSKQPPSSDLKHDLLKDRVQIDQRLKTAAPEKENRRLHWEDGWHRSPRDADDTLYKEKTVHVNGSSKNNQYALYDDLDGVVPDRRHSRADGLSSGREGREGREGRRSPRGMREESLIGKEKSRVTVNSGRESKDFRSGDLYDIDNERSFGRYDHLSAASGREDERHSSGKTSSMRDSRYTFNDVDRIGTSSTRPLVERNRSDATVRRGQSSESLRGERGTSGLSTVNERDKYKYSRDRMHERTDDLNDSVHSISTKIQHRRRTVSEDEQTVRKKSTFVRRADLSEAKYDVGECGAGPLICELGI
jgi:hypothetical protein